jgi:putative membrane protein
MPVMPSNSAEINIPIRDRFIDHLLVYFVINMTFYVLSCYIIMKSKIVVIIVLTVLLIIFVLQNTDIVVVKFWFWDLSLPRALLLFVTFAVGLIIGFMVPTSRKEKRPEPEELP